MTPRAIFLCTGNSCRSLMAEYLLEDLSKGEWRADSAGSFPTGIPHPLAIRALSEIGIDASGAKSESLELYLDKDYDLVVTVCDNAKDNCPAFPGAKRLEHWPFPDPADAVGSEDEQLEVFRAAREQIRDKLLAFLDMA